VHYGLGAAVEEARQWGVMLLPPCVQHSGDRYLVETCPTCMPFMRDAVRGCDGPSLGARLRRNHYQTHTWLTSRPHRPRGVDLRRPDTMPRQLGLVMSFAELLREFRRRLGLTQEELAERAGLSARAVSDQA